LSGKSLNSRKKTPRCPNRDLRFQWSIVRNRFLFVTKPKSSIVNLIRRFWAAGLILVVVVAHASIIGYVRSRVARLNHARSSALDIGTFRFQNIQDTNTIYQFRLYAIADPSRRYEAEENLKQQRIEILEESEQLLRQVDLELLVDPAQTQIRDRLMEVVGKHFSEPIIQRIVITDWLQFPASTMTTTLTSLPTDPLSAPDNATSPATPPQA